MNPQEALRTKTERKTHRSLATALRVSAALILASVTGGVFDSALAFIPGFSTPTAIAAEGCVPPIPYQVKLFDEVSKDMVCDSGSVVGAGQVTRYVYEPTLNRCATVCSPENDNMLTPGEKLVDALGDKVIVSSTPDFTKTDDPFRRILRVSQTNGIGYIDGTVIDRITWKNNSQSPLVKARIFRDRFSPPGEERLMSGFSMDVFITTILKDGRPGTEWKAYLPMCGVPAEPELQKWTVSRQLGNMSEADKKTINPNYNGPRTLDRVDPTFLVARYS